MKILLLRETSLNHYSEVKHLWVSLCCTPLPFHDTVGTTQFLSSSFLGKVVEYKWHHTPSAVSMCSRALQPSFLVFIPWCCLFFIWASSGFPQLQYLMCSLLVLKVHVKEFYLKSIKAGSANILNMETD